MPCVFSEVVLLVVSVVVTLALPEAGMTVILFEFFV